MSWWATHYHGGCRHLCRDLGRTYQVSSASYAAGCYAVDTHWVRCCLQDWKAVVVPPPTAHHTAQHLRAPQSPVPRFGEQSQASPLAHRQPPPRGAYLCVTACLDCSVCRYTHVFVHVGNMYCKSRQSLRKLSSHLVHAAGAMPEPNAEQPPPPQEGERRERRHRPRFRADGTRRRTPGELAKRAPFARYWKDVQARQRRRTEEPASSSGRAPEPSWSWESWSRWDWQDDSWRGSRWKWSQASPDDDWEDRYYNDSDRQADDAADADIDVNWDDVSSDSSVHGHRGRDDESSNRSQPATKRSRSTQVSDEFVKRSVEPSPEATTGTATNDDHLTQLQRLEVIVDLLESLARSGLPTSPSCTRCSTPMLRLPASQGLGIGTLLWWALYCAHP